MAAPRLTKAQREALSQWVAEGLQSDEINQRAAQFNPPFSVTRQNVDHYRRTRQADIEELTRAGQFAALAAGLSERDERVKQLEDMANRLRADLTGDSLWVTDVKTAGKEIVYITRFNAAEVREWRGLLDDIAREMGDRTTNVKHSGDSENPVEVVHIFIPDNGRR